MGFVVKPFQAVLGCLTLFLSAALLELPLAPQSFSKLDANSSLRYLSARRLPRPGRGVSALYFSSALSITPPSAQAASKPSHSWLGFDRNIYPGDAALPILRKTFVFTSYWLSPPPGEKTNTWRGKRQFLRSQGFGFLVLYRGRETRELKNADDARQTGEQDAAATIEAAKRDGFPASTIIFLDIEEGGRLSPAYHAYIRGWLWTVTMRDYQGGFYCSGIPVKEDAHTTITTAEDIISDLYSKSRAFSIWVYNDVCPPSPGCSFPQTPPLPSLSGIDGAIVWQFAQSPRRKEFTAHCPAKYAPDGNCYAPNDTAHKWFLDVNTATSSDPSGGAK
jgi:hypothetical protein